MKLIAFILLIFGLFKLLIALNAESLKIYFPQYKVNLEKLYKGICVFLIGDGLASVIGGLYILFLT